MKFRIYVVTWIFVSYFLTGVKSDLICEILQTVDGQSSCAEPLGKRCCGWNSATGKMDSICCLSIGSCQEKYDEDTCKIPKCYHLGPGDDCNKRFFMDQTQQQLGGKTAFPVGADGVSECCELDDQNNVIDAECCIVVGGKTKCGVDTTTDACIYLTYKKRFSILEKNERKVFNASI